MAISIDPRASVLQFAVFPFFPLLTFHSVDFFSFSPNFFVSHYISHIYHWFFAHFFSFFFPSLYSVFSNLFLVFSALFFYLLGLIIFMNFPSLFFFNCLLSVPWRSRGSSLREVPADHAVCQRALNRIPRNYLCQVRHHRWVFPSCFTQAMPTRAPLPFEACGWHWRKNVPEDLDGYGKWLLMDGGH